MKLIDWILTRPEFEDAPPVLVDIGASGGLNPAWQDLAKHSVCVAFDADDREMGYTRRASKVYKELYVYNRALSSGPEGTSDFYLTKSPPCSSLLEPNTERLSAWEFADRFAVIKKTTAETMQLATALRELKLDRVDWFKTDSQGTDVRLFQGLGQSLIRRVLIAEFEPGIIDAYHGEDKLWQLMSYMDEQAFWMSDICIKGSNRIRKDLLNGFSRFERDYMVHLLKPSPGWAEVTYLSSFTRDLFSKRDHLLGWVCASTKRQHGFALELATRARVAFDDSVFEELRQRSLHSIRRSYFNFPAYFPLLHRALRRWKKVGFWDAPPQPDGVKQT